LRAIAFALAFAALACEADELRRPNPLKGGIEFQGESVRAMQADTFGNPGLLWVDRGAELWKTPRGKRNASCASCHGADASSMKGVSVRYPSYVASMGGVVDLEQRINGCAVTNQQAEPFAYESKDLLSLSAFIARRSRGMAIVPDPSRESDATFERGRAIYFQRQGQLNLACTNCHDANWGQRLLSEPISQGHPADWPAYRLEWQTMGSLERRLRACYLGVRAEMPPYGSPDLVALEVYLARRAQGLVSNPPGVRR
jgi:sulfur-oxidizing protein SoxA